MTDGAMNPRLGVFPAGMTQPWSGAGSHAGACTGDLPVLLVPPSFSPTPASWARLSSGQGGATARGPASSVSGRQGQPS